MRVVHGEGGHAIHTVRCPHCERAAGLTELQVEANPGVARAPAKGEPGHGDTSENPFPDMTPGTESRRRANVARTRSGTARAGEVAELQRRRGSCRKRIPLTAST